MSYLEHFTETQKEALIALPYRVGLWVGKSDTRGGGDADEAERAALEDIITGYAEDFLKSAFVEEIMREVLARKGNWDKWNNALSKVVQECEECCGYVADRIDERELQHFKRNLMDVALTVASAYREYDSEAAGFGDKLTIYGRYGWLWAKSRFTKTKLPDFDVYLNISRSERTALISLSKALDIDIMEAV